MSNKLQAYLKSSRLYPILVLDSLIGEKKRNWLINISGTLVLFLLLPILTFEIFGNLFLAPFFAVWASLAPRFWGATFICLAFYFSSKLLDFYFNDSYYFENVALNRYTNDDIFSITVGRILFLAEKGDALRGFFLSAVGKEILLRLGIEEEAQKEFLINRQLVSEIPPRTLTDGVLKLRSLVLFLYKKNPDFAQFLKKFGIIEKELLGATDWVVYRIEFGEFSKRWWSKSNLNKIPGLAKDWGFGATFTLDKYSWDMAQGLRYSSIGHDYSLHSLEITQLENILAKDKEANAILVGNSRDESLDVAWHLVRKIQNRNILPVLEHKRVVLFNASVFLSNFKDRSNAERELLKIFSEAQKAGNIILVIDDIYNLMIGFQTLGSSFLSLVEEYLQSNAFQIVAVTTNDIFHRFLAVNIELMNFFDRIFVKEINSEMLIHGLEETVWQIEAKYKLFFTYQSLLEIIWGADNYFAESSSSDKVVDLIAEIIPWAQKLELKIIKKNDVQKFISSKTNTPLGEIGVEERTKLQNLEIEIHKRVVGQIEAIKSISGALRRSRAGIRNLNRPIGSFLFLGPTGVGKTETAKALAEVIFGRESSLLRLDMSEFQNEEALTKLIGSFETGKTGILVDMLRENPYGVLLLDEFEKTNREVLNLFLQILDEGVFSDMRGKKVNARNIIFIATSNAGAELIWKNFKQKDEEKNTANNLINYIVTKGIFRPELLNRFDATIVFEPLSSEALEEISRLMLVKLSKRLTKQGLELLVNDYLVKTVATLGANEVFGARPMQRFIQDNIEQKIAESVIGGNLTQGDKIEFKEPDLNLMINNEQEK
ncbi:MAG: AAA family ATPase [Candidatus Paceibacterota bacterium]|jgi:ATP-dependent Clp protease ATP-binding subunit ClpC